MKRNEVWKSVTCDPAHIKECFHLRSSAVVSLCTARVSKVHTLLKIKFLYWHWCSVKDPLTSHDAFQLHKMFFVVKKKVIQIIKMFFTLRKNGSFQNLNERFFREPKVVLLWHRCKSLLLKTFFFLIEYSPVFFRVKPLKSLSNIFIEYEV